MAWNRLELSRLATVGDTSDSLGCANDLTSRQSRRARRCRWSNRCRRNLWRYNSDRMTRSPVVLRPDRGTEGGTGNEALTVLGSDNISWKFSML